METHVMWCNGPGPNFEYKIYISCAFNLLLSEVIILTLVKIIPNKIEFNLKNINKNSIPPAMSVGKMP